MKESQEQSSSQDNETEVQLNQENIANALNDSSSENKPQDGTLIQTIPLLENVRIENGNTAGCQTNSQATISHCNKNSALSNSKSHTLNNIR